MIYGSIETMSDPTKIDVFTNPTRRHMSGYTSHKNLFFDVPFISQIDGNLWQGGCETGMVLPKNIKNVISLYPWESYTVKHDLHSKLTLSVYDSLDQDFEWVDATANWLNNRLDNGPTLVHCQAGLNRSSLVAARSMTLRGMDPAEAIALIREKRSPASLCNPSFEEWLLNQVL